MKKSVVILSSFLLVFQKLIDGFILSLIWGWFVVPTFTGIPRLSIIAAIGICLMVSHLTHKLSYSKKEEEAKAIKEVNLETLRQSLTSFASDRIITITIAWVAHFLM